MNLDFLNEIKSGDTIEVIAPASSAPIEHLEQGVLILKSWGFDVVYDSKILNPQIFLAQTDEYRFKQLKAALLNKKSSMVWCLRGGYGAIRLLPLLEKLPKPKNKKILIGLSDITSLQTLLCLKWGWPSLHTSMIDRIGMRRLTDANIAELKQTLMNADFSMNFAGLQPLNKQARKKNIIRSKVFGGNLTVLASTLGTPSQVRLKGHILFLEELGERAYRIDRCLQQLKQANIFNQAKAVVFGDFTKCDEPNGDNHVQQVLENLSQDLKIPVFRGVENGHGELQRPLFFNTPSVLTCGEQGHLVVASALKKVK